jgi:hypothetical protein
MGKEKFIVTNRSHRSNEPSASISNRGFAGSKLLQVQTDKQMKSLKLCEIKKLQSSPQSDGVCSHPFLG